MKRFAFAVALILSCNAHAAKSLTSGDDAPRCEPGALKVATGRPGVGFSKLFKDITQPEICGNQVKLCEVTSEGGFDNLTILTNKKADIGMAAIDTVRDLAAGDESVAALQGVAALNYNYLHVITRANGYVFKGEKKWGGLASGDDVKVMIRKFSDLKGRTIALAGSAQLMGRALAARQFKSYGMVFYDVKDEAAAIADVKSGKAQAAFITTGVPNGKLEKLTPADGIMLVEYDEDVGGNYVKRKVTYKGMLAGGLPILASQNVLLTRPFGEEKARQVAEVSACIKSKLGTLRDGDYSPAWNEMRWDVNELNLPKFNAPQVAAPAVKRK